MRNFLFVFFLLTLHPVFSQSFEIVLSETDSQYSTDIIEVSNGYIVSIIYTAESMIKRTKLVLLNFEGKIIKNEYFPETRENCQSNFLRLSNNKILHSNIFYNDTSSVRSVKYRILDNDLNILDSLTVNMTLTNKKSGIIKSKIEMFHNGFIIHLIGYYDYELPDSQFNGMYLMKTDHQLSSVSEHFYHQSGSLYNLPDDFITYPNSDTALIFTMRNVYKINSDCILIDSFPESFYRFQIENVSHSIFHPFGVNWVNNQLLIGGGINQTILRYNSDLSQESYNQLNTNGESDIAAYFEPFSVSQNSMFVGGNDPQWYDQNSMFYGTESGLRLYKLDLDLNILWHNDYNVDDEWFYSAFNILATSDGGCIITASRNNYDTQGEQVDLYLLKVDSLGNYTPMVNIQEPEMQNYVVYPNPGSRYFTIETEFEHPYSEVRLYNNTGQIVAHKRLENNKETIETPNLPTGIYFYEVRSNSEIIGRGKWIKQ